MSAEYLSFGDWLKCARSRAGIKQVELAERCGYSRVWLSMIENGHREPSGWLARRIENVLGEDSPFRSLS